MSKAVGNTHLVADTKALEAASLVIKLVSRVPAPLKAIADQLIRSASSVPANLAEGHGRFGRDRQHHWRIADASAKEVDSHLRLLAVAGAVNGLGAENALDSNGYTALDWATIRGHWRIAADWALYLARLRPQYADLENPRADQRCHPLPRHRSAGRQRSLRRLIPSRGGCRLRGLPRSRLVVRSSGGHGRSTAIRSGRWRHPGGRHLPLVPSRLRQLRLL